MTTTEVEPQPPHSNPTTQPPPPLPSSTNTTTTTIHIGTRRSKLALLQTDIVHSALQKAWPDQRFEIHAMSTMGDKNQTTPLHDFGAKSLWTHELEAGLVDGSLDLIVHSLKDMPTQLPSTCALGAILPRADPRDALVMAPRLAATHPSLASLPAGAIVGTSSVRRSAQIARLYPHLRFANVRGNVGTRLAKLDGEHPSEESAGAGDGAEGPVRYSCLILAAAGLQRLGLGPRITQFLDSRHGGLLHAVGQGALGVEIRAGDERMRALLEPLQDLPTKLACLAERSLMRTLEGGCSVPIGVETEWVRPGDSSQREGLGEGDGEAEAEGESKSEGRGQERTGKVDGKGGMLVMRAIVVALDGGDYVEGERRGEVETTEQADELGWGMASELVSKGAGRILEGINLNRGVIAEQDGA